MVDFVEKLRLKGKAEEDMYFAALDRELINAMHDKYRYDQNAPHLNSMRINEFKNGMEDGGLANNDKQK